VLSLGAVVCVLVALVLERQPVSVAAAPQPSGHRQAGRTAAPDVAVSRRTSAGCEHSGDRKPAEAGFSFPPEA